MSVDDVLRRRPPGPAAALRAGRVTKVDTVGGVYVTPDGGDERHPLGPCAGAHYRPWPAVLSCPDGPHDHPAPPLAPLPVGTRVLLATTVAGPFVISWEEPRA